MGKVTDSLRGAREVRLERRVGYLEDALRDVSRDLRAAEGTCCDDLRCPTHALVRDALDALRDRGWDA